MADDEISEAEEDSSRGPLVRFNIDNEGYERDEDDDDDADSLDTVDEEGDSGKVLDIRYKEA